jgi:circadian clock protein KaiC
VDLRAAVRENKLSVIYLRPLDLSVDETLAEILEAVHRLGAKRLVIDSLSGLEVALAPTFRDDFRESLYRLVGALTSAGITVFMTSEETESAAGARFTSEKVSFITDDIILQRHVEMNGELRKVLAVVKMRGSEHSRAFWTYELTASGAVIGSPVRNFRGILTGSPQRDESAGPSHHSGLTDREARVIDGLITLREAPLERLSSMVGLSAREVADALARLIALEYAVEIGTDGAPIYRAIARLTN